MVPYFLEEPTTQCRSHFRAPSARAMMKPRTSRNIATESSTVMTTMPPVRAIPSPMDSTFLPVRRESREFFMGRSGSVLPGHSSKPLIQPSIILSSIYLSNSPTNHPRNPDIHQINIHEACPMSLTKDTEIIWVQSLPIKSF